MLTITELISRLRELDVRLSFEHDRLNCSAPKGALTNDLKAELVRRKPEIIEFLRSSGESEANSQPIERVPRDGSLTLSHAQESLWFLNQYEPDSAAYAITGQLRVTGSLDLQALERSLLTVMQRHEVLRTGYVTRDGQPKAIIQPLVDWRMEFVSLLGVRDEDRESTLLAMARERARRPFALHRPPLLRATIFELAPEDHILLVSVHHIAADGWSLAILAREVGELYPRFVQNLPAQLPDLPLQFVDYTAWHAKAFSKGVVERQLAWWKRQLQGVLPVLELPADHPRPHLMTFNGSRLRTTFTDLPALNNFATSTGSTLFMVLLGAFKLLLHRYTGETDLIVGSALAGRNHPDIESLIGLFINTVPLRTSLDDDPTIPELLNRIRETVLGALAHSDVPFDRLVAELQPKRDLNHSPVIQVMFTLQNYPSKTLVLPGLTLKPMPFDPGTCRYDLTVDAVEDNGKLELYFEYNTDLFETRTMRRMQEHFLEVLAAFTKDRGLRISEIPLLSAGERSKLLAAAEPPKSTYPAGETLHELIDDQCRRTPDRIAVAFEGTTLTYGELAERSDRLAAHLQQLGVRPGAVVGIRIERSEQMPVALLGVLKAGGAYVPIDPQYPAERQAHMLRDAGASVLIAESASTEASWTQGMQLAAIDADYAPATPIRLATPSDLAYILYTSGSTGEPKGVEIQHRALVNVLWSMKDKPGLRGEDCLLAVTTLCFDIAGIEMYLPLLVGARIDIAPRSTAGDGVALANLIRQSRTSVLQATPATWRMMLDAGWKGQPGLKALCGGEALPRQLADRLLAAGCELWNLYGPTETTIWSAAARIKPGTEPISLGEPVANTSLYILDRRGQLVPSGVAGELYIGGEGLAKGYHNRPQLTAERFISNPFRPGELLYKTGDLVRQLGDGTLLFLGRADHQVKIRGFRIEPAEIENVLARQPGVRQALVITKDFGDDLRLVAYVAVERERRPRTEDLKAAVARSLPDYMMPSSFVILDHFPLTLNGKVDRKALPKPDLRAGSSAKYEPPRTETERGIAAVWQELLKVDKVGIRDNFFDLGGHSLLVVQLKNRLQERFGRDIALIEFFQKPTVASIAPELEQRVESEAHA